MANIIIAGSRGFLNYYLLKEKMDFFLKNFIDRGEEINIITGKAKGADSLGERYAKENNFGIIEKPADWDQYGKRAGYIRNCEMADIADACVIFWDGKSPGSRHMYEICLKQNVPVRIVRYDSSKENKTVIGKMTFKEIKHDLFKLDSKYYLAHCIAGDASMQNKSMTMGIANEFIKRYNMKNKLIAYADHKALPVGSVVLIDNVFNLVTKNVYYGKPTYQTLKKALNNMKKLIVKENIKYLAMPHIGCGLDKLEWILVKQLIMEVFKDIEIEILICSDK